MSFVVPFAVGIVVGGVFKWQIDRRRQRQADRRLSWRLAQAQVEISQLQTALETAPALASAAPAQANPEPGRKDRLEQIKGIGPVFAGRLNQAGILTFADLAALTPERVREIVSREDTVQRIEPQAWIAQARQLAGHLAGNDEQDA